MPEQQEPISVKDFSSRIKSKYPEYKDIDDSILAKKMVEKYPEYKDQVLFEVVKKKEPTPSASSVGISPFQTGGELASGAVLGKIKPVPQTIQEGVQKDKKKDDSVLGGIYNTLVGSIGSVVGGIVEAESSRQRAMGIPSINIPARKITEDFINKARSSSSSLENEQARSQFDITNGLQLSDAKALLFQAPKMALDMAMGAATAGTSFFIQSVNDNAKELEANPNSAKLTPTEKAGYLFTQASVQAALEKFALDRVFKATGMGKVASDKIASEITQELIKKGAKATAKEIEELAMKKAASFASKVKRVGLKAATSGGVEGATEGVQSVGSDAIKLLTNNATGKQVFDEEDITANMVKNFVNSTVQGAAFGGVMGGAASGLQNTNKAIRNEIAKSSDLNQIQQKIAEQVELGNITEDEAAAANITAQQYAEIASKIPAEIPEEQKYKIIGGIEQRENLTKQIENTKKEISNIDPAFQEDANNNLELLEAKLEQTKDYLNDLVKGKKTTYRKETDGEKTTYYKTDANGEETKISREYYDLATAIREENKLKKQEEEAATQIEEQPTLLEQDVREAEVTGEPEQITQPIELSTEITKTKEPIASTVKSENRYDNADLMRDILSEAATDKLGSSLTLLEKNNIHSAINDYESGKISGEELKKSFLSNGLSEEYLVKKFDEYGIGKEIKNEPTQTQIQQPTEVKQPIVEEVSEVKRPTKEEKTPTTEGLNRAEAKKIHQRVKEMEAPTDAQQIALRYLAEGGKVSESAINEVAGTVKRARLNTGEKELKSSEAKLRDYYEKNGQSLDELAHSLWEKSGQEVSERDIKDALMDAIGSHNNRLEASKSYLERYNPEYQEEQYYNRLAEERAEEHAQEELKIQEWLASKGEEELELAASEEHINQLIKQYETEFERENQQSEPTSESKTNKEVSSRTSGEESKIEQEYKEIKTIKKKLKFVDDNFESIVAQLMLKNKIKRIC